MKIKYENVGFFMSVSLSDWLSIRSKEITDITDAIVMAKVDATDEDDAAALTATLTDGITVSGDYLLVEADADSFSSGGLEIGGEYLMFLGVKFSGDTLYQEIELRDNTLIVEQDGIRA